MKPRQFIDSKWKFDVDGLYTKSAKQLSCSTSDLANQVQLLSPIKPEALCHGHDLLDILAIGLGNKDALGTSKKNLSDETLNPEQGYSPCT